MTASIDPVESRTARAALGWSQRDLATRSGVGLASIKKFEVGASLHPVLLGQLRRTLEDAGVVFLEAGTSVASRRIRLGVALIER